MKLPWIVPNGILTHCVLAAPYGDMYLGSYWLRYWLVAWRHQAITWTNIDLSSMVFCYLPQFLRKYPRVLGFNEYVNWSNHTIYLKITFEAWWHHQVETFSALLAICAVNSPIITHHRWIPLTKAIDTELWCFFYLHLNKRLSEQSCCRWFEMPSRYLWCLCNDYHHFIQTSMSKSIGSSFTNMDK